MRKEFRRNEGSGDSRPKQMDFKEYHADESDSPRASGRGSLSDPLLISHVADGPDDLRSRGTPFS
jgi:hypothetical protein